MQHAMIFYLLLSFILGGIAATLLALVHHRTKSRAVLRYALAFGSMGLMVICSIVMTYSEVNIGKDVSLAVYLFILFDNLVNLTYWYFLIRMFHEILNVPYKKTGDWILFVLTLLTAALLLTPLMAVYNPSGHIIQIGPLAAYPGIYQMSLLAYIVVIHSVFVRKMPAGYLKKTYVRAFIAAMALLPLVLVDIVRSLLTDLLKPSIVIVQADIVFYPLYYAIFAVGTIVQCAGFLTAQPAALQPWTDPAFLGAFGDSHGLSDREREVIPLIARGLGNKEIASMLDLSTKTVNNHIYNLYQKLGINTRFELIGLIGREKDQAR